MDYFGLGESLAEITFTWGFFAIGFWFAIRMFNRIKKNKDRDIKSNMDHSHPITDDAVR